MWKRQSHLRKSSCFYRSDIEGAWQVYQKECQIQDRFPSDSCCVHLMRELGSGQDIAKLDERMYFPQTLLSLQSYFEFISPRRPCKGLGLTFDKWRETFPPFSK